MQCRPHEWKVLKTLLHNINYWLRYIKKCWYFSSGYCQYTKKENGCKYFHQIDECKNQGCKHKECPNRHPKKCKFDEECQFRTSCSYNHVKKSIVNEDQLELLNDILILKTEISNLKKENDQKVNILLKTHLQQKDDLKQKIMSLPEI